MYKIVYLPIAVKDLTAIIDYIIDQLKAPKSAMSLLDSFDKKVRRLATFPYSCRIYQPTKELEYKYRILSVKNYLVFYKIIEVS